MGALLAYGSTGTSSGDRGGPGTVFIEDKQEAFTYQSRLYLDGRNLYPPKPVVVNEKNPRHADAAKPTTNNADLDFEQIMLNNMVGKYSNIICFNRSVLLYQAIPFFFKMNNWPCP